MFWAYVHSMLMYTEDTPTFTINTIIISQTHTEDLRVLLHGMQTGRFCLSHIFSELFKNLVWHLSMLSLLTSLGRRGGGGGSGREGWSV